MDDDGASARSYSYDGGEDEGEGEVPTPIVATHGLSINDVSGSALGSALSDLCINDVTITNLTTTLLRVSAPPFLVDVSFRSASNVITLDSVISASVGDDSRPRGVCYEGAFCALLRLLLDVVILSAAEAGVEGVRSFLTQRRMQRTSIPVLHVDEESIDSPSAGVNAAARLMDALAPVLAPTSLSRRIVLAISWAATHLGDVCPQCGWLHTVITPTPPGAGAGGGVGVAAGGQDPPPPHTKRPRVAGDVEGAAYHVSKGSPRLCGAHFCSWRVLSASPRDVDLFTELRLNAGLELLLDVFLAALKQQDGKRRFALLYPVHERYLLDVQPVPVTGVGPRHVSPEERLLEEGKAIDYATLLRDLAELQQSVPIRHLATIPSNMELWLWFVARALLDAHVPTHEADALVDNLRRSSAPYSPLAVHVRPQEELVLATFSGGTGASAARAGAATPTAAAAAGGGFARAPALPFFRRGRPAPAVGSFIHFGRDHSLLWWLSQCIPVRLQRVTSHSIPRPLSIDIPTMELSNDDTVFLLRLVRPSEQPWSRRDEVVVGDGGAAAAAAAAADGVAADGVDDGGAAGGAALTAQLIPTYDRAAATELTSPTHAFHGSRLETWGSILRHGVVPLSHTSFMTAGAALGDGAYFGTAYSTSLSYSQGMGGGSGIISGVIFEGAANGELVQRQRDLFGPYSNRRFAHVVAICHLRVATAEELEEHGPGQVLHHGWAIVAKRKDYSRIDMLVVRAVA